MREGHLAYTPGQPVKDAGTARERMLPRSFLEQIGYRPPATLAPVWSSSQRHGVREVLQLSAVRGRRHNSI
jgi:hypothetical protein